MPAMATARANGWCATKAIHAAKDLPRRSLGRFPECPAKPVREQQTGDAEEDRRLIAFAKRIQKAPRQFGDPEVDLTRLYPITGKNSRIRTLFFKDGQVAPLPVLPCPPPVIELVHHLAFVER